MDRTKMQEIDPEAYLKRAMQRGIKSHRPQKVAYVELFGSRGAAMKRERAIKKLSHQQKQDLINAQAKK